MARLRSSTQGAPGFLRGPIGSVDTAEKITRGVALAHLTWGAVTILSIVTPNPMDGTVLGKLLASSWLLLPSDLLWRRNSVRAAAALLAFWIVFGVVAAFGTASTLSSTAEWPMKIGCLGLCFLAAVGIKATARAVRAAKVLRALPGAQAETDDRKHTLVL